MSDLAPKDLAEILAPCRPDEFLRDTFGKSFQYFRGTPGKFSALLPWDALNEILRQHRLESPRLRLFHLGKQVPVSAYQRQVQSQRRRGVTIPRINNRELVGNLREGATLILDAVDELYEPLTALAEQLERRFHERVQVNAYAGWYTSPGFDLHWDDHDVLILQLQGRKQWSVYGATRSFPLARDAEPNSVKPESPVWEGTLEDGDLLYIPRGWWHAAVPLAEPTLHLTFGIHNRTGIDLLNWITDQIRANELFRRDLPRFADPEERARQLNELRNELLSRWTPELLDDYLARYDAMAQPRTRPGLPFTAMPAALPDDAEARLKFSPTRAIRMIDEPDAGAFTFNANGRSWRFATAAKPVIEILADGQTYSLAEIETRVGAQLERDTLREFIAELVKEGLIVLL
jgi:ribosomal protein L16 Arg81 hydroxylase